MKRLPSVLLAQSPNGPARELVATVVAVRTDDLLNLEIAGTLIVGVPALSSYIERHAGDAVQVRARGRQWLVTGRIGSPVAAPVVPPETVVSWGPGPPPGPGWHTGTVYVKGHQVYVQVPGSDTVGPVKNPAILAPDSWVTYRDGGPADASQPTQGSVAGQAPILTCFIFGTRIEAALAGASSLSIRLARAGFPHGNPGNQEVHLALHDATNPTDVPPNQVAGPLNSVALQLGEAAQFTVPNDWLELLAAGVARGFSVFYAVPGVDYVIFTVGSGTITVTY